MGQVCGVQDSKWVIVFCVWDFSGLECHMQCWGVTSVRERVVERGGGHPRLPVGTAAHPQELQRLTRL